MYEVEQKQKIEKIAAENKSQHHRILAFKGAPEIVLGRCSHIIVKGERLPLDENWKKKFTKTIETLARGGERILGFAQNEFQDSTDPSQYNIDLRNFPDKDLTFVGLISLMDPPRPSVPLSIASCHSAGIKVAMVTGDHPLTAAAIARQIGLLTLPTKDELAEQRGVPMDQIPESDLQTLVVSGMELREWTEETWALHVNKRQFVFARTSPQQKLMIVEHFQNNGAIVGVTGDGVNDSPALKQANIGIAMGIAGSEVAKESADIILMDDDFSSIISGVEEGRVIFDNLAKSIMYTLSHLVPEVLPFILNMAVGLPVAISTQLILVIDLGTELAPAISLAYETPEENTMSNPPRDTQKERLVSAGNLLYAYVQLGIIESLCCFATYFYVMNHYHFSPTHLWRMNSKYFRDEAPDIIHKDRLYTSEDQMEILKQAQTAYFAAMVMAQIANLIACKTRNVSIFTHGFKNTTMNYAFIIVIAIASVIIFAPFSHVIFQSRVPPLMAFLIPLPFMAFIILHTEIIKLGKRRALQTERNQRHLNEH